MAKVIMEGTGSTPKIILDEAEGYFEISGKSLPENAYEFFKPFLDKLDKYVQKPAIQSELVFRLEYFNTSSTAHFLKIIKRFEQLHKDDKKVIVKWLYEAEDDDMREAGEDFAMLVKIPIDVVDSSAAK